MSSVSAMLTPSEIASLRQHKKELNDFGRKAFPPKTQGQLPVRKTVNKLSLKLVKGLQALTPERRDQAARVAAKLLAIRARRESSGKPIDLTTPKV